MGAAFAVALVVIYMLVVWQFGNFIVPAVIMAPIPLTLLGIVLGYWLLNAEFTATSMIGWIALAGIIVRNFILLVDFTVQEYVRDVSFFDAVNSCASRTRPIMITAFTLVDGSSVILSDPIFQGMAISLLFGVLVSTILTLIVIPLGTLSFGEVSCRRMVISMGLIRDNNTNIDEKYNVDKKTADSYNASNVDNAKRWVQSTLYKSKETAKNKNKEIVKLIAIVTRNNSQKKTTKSKKINTNNLLEKEDKSDI